MRRALAVACVAALAAAVPDAARAMPAYPLLGDGFEPLRPGIQAWDADITGMPIALAVRADGTIAFSTAGSVYWVREDGRLLRVPVPSYSGHELAFAPDGDLLVATCADGEVTPSAVFRAGPGRPATRVAGLPGTTRTTGDGGPAVNATLECPSGVASDVGGGILIADFAARRVRRIGPDGIIHAVAGNGRDDGRGDGGPAVAASLRRPLSVAALPDGAIAILDALDTRSGGPSARVRIVDPAGTITTLLTTSATDMSATPAGELLLVDLVDDRGVVTRLTRDGRQSTVTNLSEERTGMPPPLVANDTPFRSLGLTSAASPVATPDGGVLFAANFVVHYVPPAAAPPGLFGFALLPATRQAAQRLTVALHTTRAAHVRVGVWKHGRRVATAAALVAAGDASIPITQPLPAGDYELRVRATDGHRRAATRIAVLVGGLLPVGFARGLIENRPDLFNGLGDPSSDGLTCRRIDRGAVDCARQLRRRCAGVASVALTPDGTLAVGQYGSGERRCHFGAPRRRAPGYASTLPVGERITRTHSAGASPTAR